MEVLFKEGSHEEDKSLCIADRSAGYGGTCLGLLGVGEHCPAACSAGGTVGRVCRGVGVVRRTPVRRQHLRKVRALTGRNRQDTQVRTLRGAGLFSLWYNAVYG